MIEKYKFEPDYAVPPGITLKETLDVKGLSQSDLAERTAMAEKTISQIITGSAPLTLETADKFELALGIPASFWNRLELGYRESLARTEAVKRLEEEVAWLKEIPIQELIDRSYIEPCRDKVGLVREALRLFCVSSVEAWRTTWAEPLVQYRGGEAQKRHPGKVAAWLRMGEIEAQKLECTPFDAKNFKNALIEMRKYLDCPASQWYPAMKRLCAAAGVAVVFVKEIPGASLSGATRWLNKDKAILMLSLKYKTDDQVWFSFFHEAAHILKHGKKLVFIEDLGNESDTEYEAEADRFARDALIPAKWTGELPYLKSKVQIGIFAKKIGVSPGIVVGRLQRDGLMPPMFCNDLKVKLQWPKTKHQSK